MNELRKTALGIARIVTPIMCRLFGIVGIIQGIAVLGLGVFLSVRPQQRPTVGGLAMLGLLGIVSIVMGIVIFKWFTQFMMWTLRRCAQRWGLESADK